ncbi:MAG: HEAT repeat domain-containing protein [Kiritimatiellae bacterium]|nr:HEAT repeat domain-containing protein [Kiritimatiellia bacterium]
MNIRITCYMLVAALACQASPVGAGDPPDPAAARVAQLPEPDKSGKLSRVDKATAEQICRDLLDAGPATAIRLIGMLEEPGRGEDYKVRYALHHMATLAAQPGAEHTRRAFAAALASQLGGDRPRAVQGFLARQLQLVGGAESVIALGQLLLDDELCEYAAQALLAIREGAAEPLRRALLQAGDSRLPTIVQALGVLRDERAAPDLRKLLAHDDPQIRAATAGALANIGDAAAADPILAALRTATGHVKHQLADAAVQLGLRLAENGQAPAAAGALRALLALQDPEINPSRGAALEGLVALQAAGAFDDVVRALAENDPQFRHVAVGAGAAIPGAAATRRWIDYVESGQKPARAGAIAVLGQRADPAAWPAVNKALADTDEQVLLAAIPAAAVLGKEDAVRPLLAFLGRADLLQYTAARALAHIPDAAASRVLVAALPDTPPAVQVDILAVLGRRNAQEHVETILAYARHEQSDVRVAALETLGVLGAQATLDPLQALLLDAPARKEREAAEKALNAVCRRVRQPETCFNVLAKGLAVADAPAKEALLRVAAGLKTAPAMNAIVAALADPSPDVQKTAVRLLGDWPDAQPLEPLWAVAKGHADPVVKILALRGFIRAVDLAETDDVQKILRYREAAALVQQNAEKNLLLSNLAKVRTDGALELALRFLDDPAVCAEASLTVRHLLWKIAHLPPALAGTALDKLLSTAADDEMRRKAWSIGEVRRLTAMGEYAGTYVAPNGGVLQATAVAIPLFPEEKQGGQRRKKEDGIPDVPPLTYYVKCRAEPAAEGAEAPYVRFDGRPEAGKVALEERGEAKLWTGTIANGELNATRNGEAPARFALKAVERRSPTLGMKPPAHATVLLPFADGAAPSLAAWQNQKWEAGPDGSVVPHGGDQKTVAEFGDFTLHLEFMCPFEPEQRGKSRGNSGVFLCDRYEIQILDSFGVGKPGPDDCGGLPDVAAPAQNACLPPLQWQTFDVAFRAPRVDTQGNLTEPAQITVDLNGIRIHDRLPLTARGANGNEPARAPIRLQYDRHPVRFRNIWLVEPPAVPPPG